MSGKDKKTHPRHTQNNTPDDELLRQKNTPEKHVVQYTWRWADPTKEHTWETRSTINLMMMSYIKSKYLFIIRKLIYVLSTFVAKLSQQF